jgi:dTDP-4-dehydrorhamnose 3,5-epimerase
MGAVNLTDIQVTPLKRVQVAGGDVLHALRCADPGFSGFGEAYFSLVNVGAIKAWKMHQRMTLNLVVPAGEVRFVFLAPDGGAHREQVLGNSHYARLTVPPMVWFGFQGMAAPSSLVLNIADIPHDPLEVLRKPLEAFDYQWREIS